MHRIKTEFMQKVYLLVIFAMALLMTACSSSNKVPGVSDNKQEMHGRSFHKIFIEVATVDVEVRSSLENDLAATITSAGYSAVKSLDMIPFSLKELKLPMKEEIELKVKESGCDAILIVSLFRKGETINYTPGTTVKSNDQFLAGIVGSALKRGGDVTRVSAVNIPGTFSHGNVNFILQSNLYDATSEEMMCSIQSENIDIASLDKTGKIYAAGLIAQLKKEKLLKP